MSSQDVIVPEISIVSKLVVEQCSNLRIVVSQLRFEIGKGIHQLGMLPVGMIYASVVASDTTSLVLEVTLHKLRSKRSDSFRVLDIRARTTELQHVDSVDICDSDVVLNHTLDEVFAGASICNIVALRFGSNFDSLVE